MPAATPTTPRTSRRFPRALAMAVALLALPGLAPAQGSYVGDADVVTYGPGNAAPAPYGAPPQQGPYAPFPQEELDALLAPVALYPDQLLAQVLMAATFPLDVVEAARFVREHPGLTGSALDTALLGKGWDPSVLSLAAFPQVLDMMNERLEWTRQLGEAFLADQDRVMQTVQDLRRRADAAGTLVGSPQQRVIMDDRTIMIEPATPEVVYVPTYNPLVVYGPWWAPAYEPFYWQPSSFYYPGYIAAGGIGFGLGYYVGSNHWGWARPDWRSRHIAIDVHRPNRFIERRPQYRRDWVRDGWWQHRGGDRGRNSSNYGDRRDGSHPPAAQPGRGRNGQGWDGQRPPVAGQPSRDRSASTQPRESRGNEAGMGFVPQPRRGAPPQVSNTAGAPAPQQWRGNGRSVERVPGAGGGNEAGTGTPVRRAPQARVPGNEGRAAPQGYVPAPAVPSPRAAPPRAPAPVAAPPAAAPVRSVPPAGARPERGENRGGQGGERGQGRGQGGENRGPAQQQ